MEIKRANEIGFCFGVRRAIELMEKAAGEHGGVETLGAVVHNKVVVKRLEGKGIRVVKALDEITGGIVAISSHGIGPQTMEAIQRRGLRIIDATCPRVRHAQHVARDMARAGFHVVVFGDAGHPEVRGVLAWAEGKGTACLDEGELASIGPRTLRLGILSQTTQSHQSFSRFAGQAIAMSMPRAREIRIANTICEATRRRQAAAVELAQECDVVLVVGGHTSANSRRLVEACAFAGVEAYLVETADEVQPEWVAGGRCIGITAGTSTPDETIEEVIARLGSFNE